jgi:ADP-ribose pyrophosphatase YjhB (NUDIX family)
VKRGTGDGVHDSQALADVAVLAQGQVLLVRYRDARKYDGQSGWFLPDDYLEHAEHPDAAATRILEEQVGMSDQEVVLNHIESFDGDGSPWHLVFHYHTGSSTSPSQSCPGATFATPSGSGSKRCLPARRWRMAAGP